MDGKIALEEHATTEANNALWDAAGEDDRNGHAYARSVAARLLDLDSHLREMDRSGVEFTILSLTAPGVQSVADPSRAVDLARSTNDELAGHVRRHADRLSAFAAVPMQAPEAAALELARAVGEHGFKGALINGYSTIGGEEDVKYLDEGADVFWAKAAELDVPVYLHPREPLPSQRRAMQGYPELVGSAWGFGYETATHAVRLMLSGLFDRYPTLQVIVGHLGEGLPFLLPRLQHRLDAQREGKRGAKALHRPSYYFGRNFWLTTSGHFHARELRSVIEEIGWERVLFSTDYPFEEMTQGARWFDDLAMDPGQKYAIGRGNAVDLFKLGLGRESERLARGFAS